MKTKPRGWGCAAVNSPPPSMPSRHRWQARLYYQLLMSCMNPDCSWYCLMKGWPIQLPGSPDCIAVIDACNPLAGKKPRPVSWLLRWWQMWWTGSHTSRCALEKTIMTATSAEWNCRQLFEQATATQQLLCIQQLKQGARLFQDEAAPGSLRTAAPKWRCCWRLVDDRIHARRGKRRQLRRTSEGRNGSCAQAPVSRRHSCLTDARFSRTWSGDDSCPSQRWVASTVPHAPSTDTYVMHDRDMMLDSSGAASCLKR